MKLNRRALLAGAFKAAAVAALAPAARAAEPLAVRLAECMPSNAAAGAPRNAGAIPIHVWTGEAAKSVDPEVLTDAYADWWLGDMPCSTDGMHPPRPRLFLCSGTNDLRCCDPGEHDAESALQRIADDLSARGFYVVSYSAIPMRNQYP